MRQVLEGVPYPSHTAVRSVQVNEGILAWLFVDPASGTTRFDRNPNTGGLVADANAKETRKAMQTVYHEHERYSYALLPVVASAPAELISGKEARYVPKRSPADQAASGSVTVR